VFNKNVRRKIEILELSTSVVLYSYIQLPYVADAKIVLTATIVLTKSEWYLAYTVECMILATRSLILVKDLKTKLPQ